MRWLMIALLLVLCGSAPALADGPSFDCSRVTATVTKTICANPTLSALDRKLADDFNNIHAQGDIDAKALDADESKWLRDVRNRCTTTACIEKAYQDRDAALLDQSLKAASPAAYAETRPFPAAASTYAAAKSLVGASCNSRDLPNSAGFTATADYRPILLGPDWEVLPRMKDGTWFAFLFDLRKADDCRITDVVTLPGPNLADAWLSCTVPADDGSSTPQSIGAGMRLGGKKELVGYWDVAEGQAKLMREPIDLLDWSSTMVCRQPETGD
jgi:uncharacterized protein